MELIDWLSKHPELCPKCGGYRIRGSLVKCTKLCPKCGKIWKFIRNEHSWTGAWFYTDKSGYWRVDRNGKMLEIIRKETIENGK